MLLNRAFPNVKNIFYPHPTKLKFVTPHDNRQKKTYVCNVRPFNDMGNVNWNAKWEDKKKPTNFKAYETIIYKEVQSKVNENVKSYIVQKEGWEFSAQYFKTKSKKKSDNVFRYYLGDVFVRIDLNNFNRK